MTTHHKTVSQLHDSHVHLETRVATVEANLDAMSKNIADLTTDVRALAQSTREQGQQFEAQMRELLVAVTNASGPRKTEWGVIINAVGLILAIGAAVFAPLTLRMNDNQQVVGKLETRFTTHEQLQLHPVGQARIDALEKATILHQAAQAQALSDMESRVMTDMHEHNAQVDKELTDLRLRGSPDTRERLAVLEAQAALCRGPSADRTHVNGTATTSTNK